MVRGCRLSWASASLQQTQRSVHNSNSCSCILIQSAGLSLKRSIFLHFRNYSRARECGPADPRGWSPVHARLSLHTSTLSANLSNPSSASRSRVFTRQSVSLLTFTSRHFVYILTIQRCIFLDDSKMNFVHWSNLWKSQDLLRGLFLPFHIFSTLLSKTGLFFSFFSFFLFPSRQRVITWGSNRSVFVWLL